MVLEGLKKRIQEGVEKRKEQAQQSQEAAKTQKAIFTSTYNKTYARAKNKETYNAAIARAKADAHATVARNPQGGGGGSLGTVGTILKGGASGFQKAAKYGKADPFGMGGNSSGDPFGLGSLGLGGGGEKKSSGSSQPDYLGLGSIGLGEPARKVHHKHKGKGKTITIKVDS